VRPETSDITVVIPYYNRERYIDEAVQSVLAQTLRPLEIIIVNDCSRESSRRYLDRYTSSCKIIDLPANVGLAGARNAGIRAARGEFIAFLDDDDIWLPQKLELQRQYMEDHPECAVVHSAALFFFQDGREEYFKQFWFSYGPMWLAQALTNGSCALIPTVLARSEVVRAVGGFDVEFREVEDRDFIVRCCAAGYRVEGIEDPLIRVRRQDQDGLTQRPWRIYRADLKMCWKHRMHYLRAYGLRGVLSFVIEKAQAPSRTTRYLNEVMSFLLQFVKYPIKPNYRDPVLCNPKKPLSVVQHLSQRTNLLKKEFSMRLTSSDISVIIPFYNRELYIDEAIRSVLAQTLKPLEIIIVNDCSRESSRRYLDRFADVCKIVDLHKNIGLAGSRNAGIRVARGKFIALLDDDDIWLPEKLEMQRKYLEERPECSVVHSAVCAFYSNHPDHVFGRFDSGPMPLAQALRDEYWAVPSTLMFRTSAIRAIDGFDVRFRECEDRDFLIRCCAAGYRVEGIPEPLIRLRRTLHGSLSEQNWTMFRAHFRVVWKHKTLYFRAYGLRGATNFLVATLHMASFRTRYVDGAVRLLLRLHGRNWVIRPGYRDPVQLWEQDEPMAVEASVAAARPRRHSA